MPNDDVIERFNFLYDDISEDDDFEKNRPLLAHYTSIEVLEKIVTGNEIWFSNPLLMNDSEEVRAGFYYGARALRNSDSLRTAFETEERFRLFNSSVDYYINEYDEKYLFDTYVFCLSEHERSDEDGLLSMWRGYGGNGKGVAIVIDTEQLVSLDGSPLIFSKVKYVSAAERKNWLNILCDRSAEAISSKKIDDDEIYKVAFALVERIKMAALFSKHKGFDEEKEWRAVYIHERDPQNLLNNNFHYIVGSRGVEPKLKLQFKHIPGVTPEHFSLKDLVAKIIIGPGGSSPLSERAIKRMLILKQQPELAERLKVSSIPYRPLG